MEIECRRAFEEWAKESDKGPIKPFTSWSNDFCWFAWQAAWNAKKIGIEEELDKLGIAKVPNYLRSKP